jgi:hypothetical protein
VQFGQRLEMARALRDAFNDRYSAGFSPDKEHRRKVSAAFDALVGDGEKMEPVKALQQFSKRPEVQQLLTQLGLS